MASTKEFLKEEGTQLIFKGDGELVYYIPESYFRPDGKIKYAEIAGEYVNTLGLFNYEVFDSNGKSIYGVKQFYQPVLVSCIPSSIDTVKEYLLEKKINVPVDYRVLHFKKDDVAIANTQSPQDITNVENMFKLFMITGRIPNTIPYDQLHTFLMDSIKFNGNKFGITAQMFGILISELCRDPKDESIPFILSGEKDMHNYKPISIKMVPKYISAFASITSENWDDAVVNAIINKNKIDSPMEKILMG